MPLKKSEQIQQKRLQQIQEGNIPLCDWEGFAEFLDAIVEEALEERDKLSKERAKAKS